MHIALHKNARTTPAVRAEIAASSDTAAVLAQRYGITEQTVYKWKRRQSFQDRSHTAHRLQTQLTPAQEAVVVQLRRTLLLPLDDLLAVTRDSSVKASRAQGLTGVCVATAWATSMGSSRVNPRHNPRHSSATSRATSMWM